MTDREKDNLTEGECYELPVQSGRSMIWCILSLVLGVLSVVTCPIYVLGILLGIGSFVLSLYSRKKHGFFTKIAVFGLILSITGTVFGIFSLIISVSGILN